MSKPTKIKPPRSGVIEIDPPRFEKTAGAFKPADWRSFRMFDSEEHRLAWERQLQEERETAAREQREKLREAEQARKPPAL